MLHHSSSQLIFAKLLSVRRYIFGSLLLILSILVLVGASASQASIGSSENILGVSSSTASETATTTATVNPNRLLSVSPTSTRAFKITPNIVVSGTSGIVVNNFNQEPSSQIDGTCTLAKAIVAVNTHAQQDTCRGDLYTTIILNYGTYVFNSADSNNGATRTPNALPVITGNQANNFQVSIEGNNSTLQDKTIGLTLFRLVEIASNANVTIKNITFYEVNLGSSDLGAGVYNSGNTTITGCVFSGAFGVGAGAGIYNEGTLSVINTLFISNLADYGGAIGNSGLLSVLDSSFIHNGRDAIWNRLSGNVTISKSVFILNNGDVSNPLNGDAILNFNSGSITIRNSCFLDNALVTSNPSIRNSSSNPVDASNNWWNYVTADAGTPKAGGSDGRPGTVGPNTDPNADRISAGVNWAPALTAAPNFCQQFVPRSIQWPGNYRQSNRTFYLYGQTVNPPGIVLTIPFPFGANNGASLPVIGNWTGGGLTTEGYDKLGIYDNSTALFWLCTVDTSDNNINPCSVNNVMSFQFGNPNNNNSNIPLGGHWSPGASHDGIGIFQQSNGLAFLRNQLSSGFADYTMLFGNPGDLPVAGAWTGNGTDSLGMYRPSTQTFYLVADEMCNCTLYSDFNFQLGATNNAYPVAADWLGDGHSSVGVYDNTFKFTFQEVLDSNSTDFTFGPLPGAQPGDLPLTGHWSNGCSQPPGNSIQSGRPIVCDHSDLTPATTTLTPTYVATLPTNAYATAIAQTVTSIPTYIANGSCVLQVQNSSIPLMNNDLATIAPNGVLMPLNTVLIPSYGRGSLYDTRTPPPFYSFYSVNYFGQSGWVYGAVPVGPQANTDACKAGRIPTQVLNYQVPSTLQPAPIYVPTVQLTTTPGLSPVPGSTLDCSSIPSSGCLTPGNMPPNPATPPYNARNVFDDFQAQFIAMYGRPLTMKDVLATLIDGEWWTTLANNPNVVKYGSEGFARSYYANCKFNVCTPTELSIFLAGYELTLSHAPHDLGATNVTASNLMNIYKDYLTNSDGRRVAIDVLVNQILIPQNVGPTPYWVDGGYYVKPWQWFTFPASCNSNKGVGGSGRPLGTNGTSTLYRVFVQSEQTYFEMYTLAQTLSLGSGPCRDQ